MALPQHSSNPVTRCLSFICLVLVLVLTVLPHPVAAAVMVSDSELDQIIQNDDVLDVIKEKQSVKIDGTRLMQPINRALKQSFKQEYPDTDVSLRSNGTEPAIEALLKDDIDLAAIGRPLSTEEKAKGLIEIPVSEDAISIIIGRKNRFNGHLTLEQFAQIFRGEITDWSEVGGTPGAIRFIDRPLSSDTRFALSKYGILGESEQAQGEQVVRLETDDTAEVIRQLGSDGISYAIASQITNQRKVKPVKIAVLLDTLPYDQYYPYSQVRGYAYKKDNASAVLPFVNWATGESGKAAVVTAKTAEAAAVNASLKPPVIAKIVKDTTDVAADATAATGTVGFFGRMGIPVWLWWLLPMPLLLFLFLFGRRRRVEDSPEPVSKVEEGAQSEPLIVDEESVTEPEQVVTEPEPTIPPPPVPPGPDVQILPVEPPEPDVPEAIPAPSLVVPIDRNSKEWDVPDIVYGKAQEYFSVGQYDLAEELFGRFLVLSPTNILGIIGLGKVFLRLGQGDNALARFEQAIELDATEPDAWIGKGDALMLLGRGDDAQQCYDQVNILRSSVGQSVPEPPSTPPEPEPIVPDASPAPVLEVPDIKPDITVDEPALPSPPLVVPIDRSSKEWDVPDIVYGKALEYFLVRQYDLAEALFGRLLVLSPTNILGIIGLGKVFLRLGQGDNALARFERAIELDATESDAWIGKGDALMLLGRGDEAMQCYDQVNILRSGVGQSVPESPPEPPSTPSEPEP
ncbi:MAG: substrate-binding domain-containing protein, partial [Cyanobacteria bacterium P01_F01_bin.116]